MSATIPPHDNNGDNTGQHKATTKEQSSSSEDKELTPQQTTEQKVPPVIASFARKVSLQENHYDRLGFYRAISSSPEHTATLGDLLKDLEDVYQQRNQEAIQYYTEKQSHYNQQIADKTEEIKEIEKSFERHEEEQQKRFDKRNSLVDKIKSLITRLTTELKNVDIRRNELLNTLFTKRLLDHSQEIDQIIDNRQILAQKRYEIYLKNYNENKHVYDAKVNRFQDVKSEVQDTYVSLKQKIKVLHNIGLTDRSIVFLNIIGYIGLIAAGWLFSVYYVGKPELFHVDYISFLLLRLFNFADQLLALGNIFSFLLVFIGGWLLFLGISTVLIWGCEKLIYRKYQTYPVASYAIIDEEEEELLAYHSMIHARSLLASWLLYLPYLFFLGVAFIIIAAGKIPASNQTQDLSVLLTTLSGEVIGTAIAIIITGITILYTAFMIEKRHPEESPSFFELVKQHWEISTLLVIFSIIMSAIVIHESLAVRFISSQSIALGAFSAIVFITAFIWGYSIRYRGLLDEIYRLENYIKKLSIAIENNSRPHHLDVKMIEKKAFVSKVDQANRELVDIAQIRNEQLKTLYYDLTVAYPMKRKPVIVSFIPKWATIKDKILFMRINKNDDPLEFTLPEVNRNLEYYFPDIFLLIGEIQQEIAMAKKEYNALEELIKTKEDDKDSLKQETVRRIETYQEKIRLLQTELLNCQEDQHNCLRNLRLEKESAEAALRDGYDLGTMYLHYTDNTIIMNNLRQA